MFTHGSQQAADQRIDEFMRSGYYGLLALRDQGVIKAFGGGINEWQMAQTLAERGDFDLFLLAGRYTLLEQEALNSFLPLCQKRGIGIVLGGPYNSGILATGAKPGAFYNYDVAPQEILDRVARINAVCQRHNVRLIEAALNFPLLNPAVVSIIPGGQRPAEVESNRSLLDKKLPVGLWADLKQEGLMRDDAPTG
jgi:D-threo-aldose 1-dehydrogenase